MKVIIQKRYANISNMNENELIEKLKKVTKNLYYQSESDYRIKPLTHIEIIDFKGFLDDSKQKELIDVLENNLRDIKVIKIGEVEIDIYIIGRTNSGKYIGVKTKSIET